MIFAPLNGIAGVRVAPFLGSDSVKVLDPFDSYVPYHPTVPGFSRPPPVYSGSQYGAARGHVRCVQAVGFELLGEEAASDVHFLVVCVSYIKTAESHNFTSI